MPWAKIDDGWWCHPKVMVLPMAARGLWASALSWSCAQRRDVVPTPFLAMVGADPTDADALVEAGLWVSVPDGWRIHDWSEYQERTLSEKRAEAGRKGGMVRPTEAKAKQTEVASEADAQAGTHPFPSQPNPSSSSVAVLPVSVDNVLDAIADLRLETAKASSAGVRRPQSWRAKCRDGLDTECGERVASLLDQFDEPARVIAEVVEGRRRTQLLRRRGVDAPVATIGAVS